MPDGFDREPQSEAGGPCPRNLFGISSHAELSVVERIHAQQRSLELVSLGITGRFDTAHLRSIHRHPFQDAFPWAVSSA